MFKCGLVLANGMFETFLRGGEEWYKNKVIE